MVNGIDIFREHFNHFKEQYTVIGGFACDLLMNDAGLDFRQTVDIDMVLIVEALTTDFAKAFWAFIEAGGYQARQRSNGQPEFYRFVDPTNPAYPKSGTNRRSVGLVFALLHFQRTNPKGAAGLAVPFYIPR